MIDPTKRVSALWTVPLVLSRLLHPPEWLRFFYWRWDCGAVTHHPASAVARQGFHSLELFPVSRLCQQTQNHPTNWRFVRDLLREHFADYPPASLSYPGTGAGAATVINSALNVIIAVSIRTIFPIAQVNNLL